MTTTDNFTEEVSPIDYAVLMKDILIRLQEGINNLDATVISVPNLQNLVHTALDYLFYLEDNRRVIM